MLDIKFIEENKKKIIESCQKRNLNCDIEKLLNLNKERIELLREVEDLNSEKNKLNEQMKDGSKTDKDQLIEKGKQIKQKLAEKEPELESVEKDFQALMNEVPNVVHPDVPVGKDENENVVLRKAGEPNKFDFVPKDHMELGESLDIIDTKTAARVSGSRFNYIKGSAAMLQFAIVQFVFDKLSDEKVIAKLAKQVGNTSAKPFIPVVPPVIIKGEVAKKMDRFDPIEDRYYLEKDKAMFVGSAEHSLGPMYMGEVIYEKELPLRFIGYSTAFRREAGSYGKDTRGILRSHQFDKLEMEIFSTPEAGEKEQDLIVAIQEHLVSELKIPYQVVAICTGDMGKPDYRQIDIECWMPGQEKYRETHTSDYMTDFQARRLKTKLKRGNGKTEYIHMNDATAFAIGRIMIAIVENYQQADGSIIVPEALRKYMPRGLEKIG